MSSIEIFNRDNLPILSLSRKASIVFADFVYENKDFRWVGEYWEVLENAGVFMAMTDFHTICELGVYMKNLPNSEFINHIVWKNEWGNHPKDRFHQCFDDILIFAKGNKHKFYSDRVQIPKATANTKLNPSGRQTKTATAFISDCCLTTVSKERIKKQDGHLIKWQKPLSLIDRILLPFSDENDLIIDPFMGSGTIGEWCKLNNRDYIGFENDLETFKLAEQRIKK